MGGRTPLQSLLFLLLVGLLALITMWAFPKDGVKLTDSLTLKYESLNEFFGGTTDKKLLSVEDSLLSMEGVDSVAIRDSLARVAKLRHERVMSIQHSDSTNSSLNSFYESLKRLHYEGGKIRILHYGDSQIEGDRMTRYIRNELQKAFGGIGPGLLPAYQVIPTSAARQNQSENWLRYTAYGNKDTTLEHRDYGILASFSRFMPPPDSIQNTDTLTAWLEIQPAEFGYSRIKKFNRMQLLVGGNTAPVSIEVEADSTEVYNGVLKANTLNRKLTIPFNTTPKDIKVTFKGTDSPNVYGISLEGTTGILVDNIPLRGSSGTLFRGINKELLRRQYASEPIKLVILQFGGNTIPYIDSKDRADKFGNYFKANLRYLKALLPEASFIVIGPSDMSTKIKGKYVTYPMLETIRDEVQNAAREMGMAYYDMYEVMGGKNSMPEWVTADPPLAGPDYVHFTSKGAKKMVTLFYEALMKDYQRYLAIQQDTLKTDTTAHEK